MYVPVACPIPSASETNLKEISVLYYYCFHLPKIYLHTSIKDSFGFFSSYVNTTHRGVTEHK